MIPSTAAPQLLYNAQHQIIIGDYLLASFTYFPFRVTP